MGLPRENKVKHTRANKLPINMGINAPNVYDEPKTHPNKYSDLYKGKNSPNPKIDSKIKLGISMPNVKQMAIPTATSAAAINRHIIFESGSDVSELLLLF